MAGSGEAAPSWRRVGVKPRTLAVHYRGEASEAFSVFRPVRATERVLFRVAQLRVQHGAAVESARSGELASLERRTIAGRELRREGLHRGALAFPSSAPHRWIFVHPAAGGGIHSVTKAAPVADGGLLAERHALQRIDAWDDQERTVEVPRELGFEHGSDVTFIRYEAMSLGSPVTEPSDALEVVAQLARGPRLVHLDLAPWNIFRGRNGLQLLDLESVIDVSSGHDVALSFLNFMASLVGARLLSSRAAAQRATSEEGGLADLFERVECSPRAILPMLLRLCSNEARERKGRRREFFRAVRQELDAGALSI